MHKILFIVVLFMLISLRFSNFYSFAGETLIDFTVGKKPAESGFDINVPNQRLNKVIAVVGANGSGKTQLIKPLAFLSWFITSSFLERSPDQDIPYSPHALHPDAETNITLHFLLNEREYRYQLIMQKKRVLSETLSVKSSNQFSYLFKWEKSAEGFNFKEKGFPFPAKIARTLRDNTSLLAAAYSYDIEEAKTFIDFFASIIGNVVSIGRMPFRNQMIHEHAKNYYENAALKERMVQVMREFDLGLADIEIKEINNPAMEGKESITYVPYGLHQDENGNSFKLPFWEESNGTQSAFIILTKILTVLMQGGHAVMDELDNDLHPHLIPKIIDWFRFEHSNPHRAQLIFTCHTPEVLNRLQKHQIYLCEKRSQYSEAWRLDEVVGLRADDNLYAKYMAGALGAVPEV